MLPNDGAKSQFFSLLSGAALGCLALCVTGCASVGTATGNPQTPEADPLPAVELYFPLLDGTIYQYTTTQPNGSPGVMVLNISRPDEEHATLTTGNSIQHLIIEGETIRNEAGHTQLKLPLIKGQSWPGPSGPVRVTAVKVAIQVEAGSYTDCIQTEEQTQATVEVRTTRSIYCPNVGLVSLEVESDSGGVLTRETAKLRYFGPKIDINDL
jgi:hypothetical protein